MALEEGADSILVSWAVVFGASPRCDPIGSWFGFDASGDFLVPGPFQRHVRVQHAFPLSWVWALPYGASRLCSSSCPWGFFPRLAPLLWTATLLRWVAMELCRSLRSFALSFSTFWATIVRLVVPPIPTVTYAGTSFLVMSRRFLICPCWILPSSFPVFLGHFDHSFACSIDCSS